uniref:Uncharacterized protein n=1 Tax=Siphoviridae sp. ctZd434 TaxID=2825559 RepID=A0A8S5UHC5_9CAUD|nr:MAG TPA: hypothetical protein [Siphoviridae sp. ctZd434]
MKTLAFDLHSFITSLLIMKSSPRFGKFTRAERSEL